MILIDNKIIEFKGYKILKEETDRKPKFLYSILDKNYKYNCFYTLKEVKQFINNLWYIKEW